jgi:hypothetical protein
VLGDQHFLPFFFLIPTEMNTNAPSRPSNFIISATLAGISFRHGAHLLAALVPPIGQAHGIAGRGVGKVAAEGGRAGQCGREAAQGSAQQ